MICVAMALAALVGSGRLEGVLGQEDYGYDIAPVPTVSSSKLQIAVSLPFGERSRRGWWIFPAWIPRGKIQSLHLSKKRCTRQKDFLLTILPRRFAEMRGIYCVLADKHDIINK